MQKKIIFKKGKIIIAQNPKEVLTLAKKLLKILKPFSQKIAIAGSIRRKELSPVDIDVVLIPKNKRAKENLEKLLAKKGRYLQGGEKKSRFKINGTNVELYYTNEKSWGACLLAYSSRFGSAIGLRVFARRKGFLLNQYGLFDRRTKKYIAGKTEKEIYKALGKKYKEPWLR